MDTPKILNVSIINNTLLLVDFDNYEQRQYDITPLLSKPAFADLKDPMLFKQVKVDIGGYALVWNKDIDLSEHEVWCNGTTV